MKVATLALGLLVALTGFASGQTPDAVRSSSLPPSVARFLGNRAESLTQFRAARHLEATNTRFNKHGWMDVVTELSLESGFSFQVVAEGGSEYIRKKVLRPILEGEREIYRQLVQQAIHMLHRVIGQRDRLSRENRTLRGQVREAA